MCQHPRLKFGSGDFYIFCADCPKKWMATKQEHPFVPDDTVNRGPFGERHANPPLRVLPPREPYISPDLLEVANDDEA